MPRSRLALSIALSDNPNTRPLIDGDVAPEGISLTPTVVHPSEMFWRQLKFAEFDVSEMSMSSLVIATARGPTPWVALPVFTTREFFHTRILVRADAGIDAPADLSGKRVGVPEYQQTAAIWGRGALENEFGVRPRDMEFFMERGDKSHGGATGFKPPAGVTVHQIPADHQYRRDAHARRTRRDAALPHRTPIWSTAAASTSPPTSACGRCFPTAPPKAAATTPRPASTRSTTPWWSAARWWSSTPGSRSTSIRPSPPPAPPCCARAPRRLASHFETGVIGDDVRRALATDPMAYGVKATRKVLETIADYVHAQGLTDRRVKIEELFAPATMDL